MAGFLALRLFPPDSSVQTVVCKGQRCLSALFEGV